MADVEDFRKDMEAFFKMAKYPLVRQTDMSAEMREEAVDVCVTAVEKHQSDMEKCTQVIYHHHFPAVRSPVFGVVLVMHEDLGVDCCDHVYCAPG